jgi:tetratricopeptide (TPR) repeat protein
MAQALEQSRSGWSHLKAKRFRNGIKHFRRAVALLPGVPKFRADLALALQLAGEAQEAVIQATAALQGYAADLTGDAAERREARRTLGRSLRTVAEEKFGQRQLDEAIREMRKASRELEDSLVDEPEGPTQADVRSEIREIRERLAQWERIWSKVSGVSTLPEESSPRD